MGGIPDVLKRRRAQKQERERLKRLRESNPELQRKLGKQMADIEFQMDIAPRLNYKGPIDPDMARLQHTEHPSLLRGYYLPPDSTLANYSARVRTPEGEKYVRVPAEPGTVNAVNVENAQPQLWAHEYRHKQSQEPANGMPRIDELTNRIMDAYNAQNITEFRRVADNIESDFGKNTTELIEILRDMSANKEREVERWNSITRDPETNEIVGDFFTEVVRPYENLQPYLVDNPLFKRILGAKNGD